MVDGCSFLHTLERITVRVLSNFHCYDFLLHVYRMCYCKVDRNYSYLLKFPGLIMPRIHLKSLVFAYSIYLCNYQCCQDNYRTVLADFHKWEGYTQEIQGLFSPWHTIICPEVARITSFQVAVSTLQWKLETFQTYQLSL